MVEIQTVWYSGSGAEHLREKQQSGGMEAMESMGMDGVGPEENVRVGGSPEEKQRFLETAQGSVRFLEPEVDRVVVVNLGAEGSRVDLRKAPLGGAVREKKGCLLWVEGRRWETRRVGGG